MNWAWAASFDQLWRSPALPTWLTLAAAAFFALVVLFALVRAERSVANITLTVITLVVIGVGAAAALRGFDANAGNPASDPRSSIQLTGALPALSCLDGLAGESVEAACEKALFGTADSTAAAVSYTAAQITRLISFGDVAAANGSTSSELNALRRAIERDRYGLVAQVLTTRDQCNPSACAAFQSLTDHKQIAANMAERAFEGVIARHATSWNAPPVSPPAAALTAFPGSVPTGKPTSADFPTAASIPPVNIMSAEPPPPSANAPSASAPVPRPPPAASTPRPALAAAPANGAAAPKKQSPPKSRPSAPVQLAPAPTTADN